MIQHSFSSIPSDIQTAHRVVGLPRMGKPEFTERAGLRDLDLVLLQDTNMLQTLLSLGDEKNS